MKYILLLFFSGCAISDRDCVLGAMHAEPERQVLTYEQAREVCGIKPQEPKKE